MFELILGLEQDGWVLQPLQAGQRPSRGELRYVLGDDTARKVFYIREGPAPLCRVYFMACPVSRAYNRGATQRSPICGRPSTTQRCCPRHM